MPPTQTNSRSNQIRHLKLSDIQAQTNNSESMLQGGTTPLLWAAIVGHVTTAEVLLKAGADVNARDKVMSNLEVAIISMVYSLAMSVTLQYTSVSTVCEMYFSNIDNASDTDQQQKQPDPASEVVRHPVTN